MSRFNARRQKLRALLRKAGLPAFLATNPTNVSYLTGFTGDSSYLLLTAKNAILISDGRYTSQLEEECPDVGVYIRATGTQMSAETAIVIHRNKVAAIGFESDHATVSLIGELQHGLSKTTLEPTSGMVEQLRAIKDKDELAAIREAARIAERAFAILRASLRPELTEKQIADDLEHQMRLLGAQCAAFPPIVAAGPRAALPHARPEAVPIGDHHLLLVDWGAQSRQYKSDLTRVLATGKISPKHERVYGVVLEAQHRAIAAIRPGVTAKEVDAVARGYIDSAGFGKCFNHGLGHGFGLDIHESPRMHGTNNQPLQAGMVVTVEPGVYLPGWGGVRIEDDVLVVPGGCEVLTSLPKDIESTIVI